MAMARPMGRPSSPPFALITMVVLFLIAAVVAVVFYLQWQKAEDSIVAANVQAEKASKELTSLRGGTLNLLDKVTPSAAQMRADAEAAAKAVAEVNAVLAQIKDAPNSPNALDKYKAVDAIRMLSTNRDNIFASLQKAQDESRKLAGDLLKVQQDLAATEARVREIEKSDLEARTALLDSHKTELDKLRAEVAEANKQRDETSGQLNEARIQMHEELGKKDREISLKENRIRELEAKLRKNSPEVIDKIKSAVTDLPDGAVLQVFPETSSVYLRLNRPDQAKLGMRYVVHSKGKAIPDNGQGKAVVEVSSIENGVIQAKIVKSTPGDPILPNDNVLNLIAGPVVLNFVVYGQFDLNNDGVTDSNAVSQISALIERWGGHVQDDIDEATNIVVLGGQPAMPDGDLPPGADAGTLKTREEQVNASKRWIALNDTAQKRNVPVVNGVNFLHWIGYFNDDTAPGFRKRVRPGESYFADN